MKEIHVTRVIESASVRLRGTWVLGFFRWRDAPGGQHLIVFPGDIYYEDVHHNSKIRSIPAILEYTAEVIHGKRYHPRLVKPGLTAHLIDKKTQYLRTDDVEEFMIDGIKWGEVPDEYEIAMIDLTDGHVRTDKGDLIHHWFDIFVDSDSLPEQLHQSLISDQGKDWIVDPVEIMGGWIVSVRVPDADVESFQAMGSNEKDLLGILKQHLTK